MRKFTFPLTSNCPEMSLGDLEYHNSFVAENNITISKLLAGTQQRVNRCLLRTCESKHLFVHKI